MTWLCRMEKREVQNDAWLTGFAQMGNGREGGTTGERKTPGRGLRGEIKTWHVETSGDKCKGLEKRHNWLECGGL